MKRIFDALGKLNRGTYVVLVLCAMTAIALPAQTFTTLFSFEGTNGAQPTAGLVQGANGDLYGATGGAGAHLGGTIFEFTPSGMLTTLHNFCSRSGCTDGADPVGLVQATNGDFYGTTALGGVSGCSPSSSCGTILEITPSGMLTTLYSFCSSQTNCPDGYGPLAGLIQATGGNFYGTTQLGGAHGSGTVFEITPSGALTTLYSFCPQPNCTDGSEPYAGLVQATNGDFYGTTTYGGANGVGTVFKITASGTLTTLYSFDGAHGAYPYAGLVQATNGDLYGTTGEGGTGADCISTGGCGTVFKITPSGALSTLYSFCSQSGCADGEHPPAGLVQGTDGNLYGTIRNGGANKGGAIFKMTPSGALTTLYSFCSQSECTDGYYPETALLQDTNGNFYGVTPYGGANCGACGTIFSLSVGLGPFVKTLPHNGKVSQVIRILGTDLTGATAVTFNGTPAVFTIDAPTEITAAVPPGATTGAVQVTTPTGTLLSAGPFTVLP